MTAERLQKILARAGHGSRRHAEGLITAGRVTVNGVLVTELGTRADPASDRIEVDGKRVTQGHDLAYLAMHKPAGAVTTASDPQGRMTVISLLPKGLPAGVVPIGRLDRDTAGLLLFTNDGELAHRIAHPSYNVEKEYFALVAGAPSADDLDALRTGVDIGDHVTSPAEVVLTKPPAGHHERPGNTWVRLVIHEGRKRQVRLMCAAINHDVRILVRTRIGPITIDGLPLMSTRPLKASEVTSLKKAVGL
jgi:pseudouridine synthase